MPRYAIMAPNGREYEIEGPEGATDEQVRAEVLRQFPEAAGGSLESEFDAELGGLTGSVTDTRDPLALPGQEDGPDIAQALLNSSGNVAAGLAEGALGIPDILWDGATGLRRGVNDAIGAIGEGALDAIGLEGAADWWREGAEGVDQDLSRMSRPSTPITNAMPIPEDSAGWWARVLSQLVGGAAIPMGSAPRPMTAPVQTVATDGQQVMQAAQRLNQGFGTKIAPLPADVAGPGIRNATGAAAKLPLAASPIVKGSQAVTAEAQSARDAIAKLAGNPSELETAGESALKGAQNYIKSSRAKVASLYNKARAEGGDEPVDLVNARAALDDQITELSQVPGGSPGLEKLRSLRAEMDKPFPVEGVKKMRTNLRDQFASDGLRGSDIERRMGIVADAAEDDIIDNLVAAGKTEAARAYKAAANAHKERVETIDNILSPIIGAKGSAPKSGEQIMEAIGSASKRNNARLGRFLDSLPAEDAATVRATLIGHLGTASKGTQNAAGDAFSLPQFLTHWNAMTPSAKRTLFGGELRAALDDLAKVAEGTKQSQSFANFSNTGGPVGLVATGGIGSQILTHPISTISFLAGQYGLGKALASPRFARWLTRVPSKGAAVPAHVNKLGAIAAAEPAIAQDVLGLQQRLQQALSRTPDRAAAEEEEQK